MREAPLPGYPHHPPSHLRLSAKSADKPSCSAFVGGFKLPRHPSAPLQHPEIRQPFLESDVPGAEGDAFSVADAAAVTAVGVDVQVGGNARAIEGAVEIDRLPGMEGIIAA